MPTGNAFRTDLALGSLALSAHTTVAQLSAALVNHNAEYAFGDRISYFSIRQSFDTAGTPCMAITKAELTLDKLCDDKVWDITGDEGFHSNNGFLGMDADSTAATGVFAYVHTRDVKGTFKVSTQSIESTNSTIVARYSSPEAHQMAVDSYGAHSANPSLKPIVTECVPESVTEFMTEYAHAPESVQPVPEYKLRLCNNAGGNMMSALPSSTSARHQPPSLWVVPRATEITWRVLSCPYRCIRGLWFRRLRQIQ